MDRGTSYYGGSYSRSYGRRSSVAESSLWRRDAGREYLGLSSDFGRSRNRLESSSSSSNLSSSSFRSYGDSSFLSSRDRGYRDSSQSYDFDRRYGSSWRDIIYPKTSPSHGSDSAAEIRDSSFIRDGTYSRAKHIHTDREIPVIKESYQGTSRNTYQPQQDNVQFSCDSTSTAHRDGESPVIKGSLEDGVSTRNNISQSKRDRSGSFDTKTGTFQTDRGIPVIQETPENSANIQADTSQPTKESSVLSYAALKTNLEIPIVRETFKAPYSANIQTDFPTTKRDSAYIETETYELKSDSADSRAQGHKIGKCKRVRFLREDSPEGVSVPIIRTDQQVRGTKRDPIDGETKYMKVSSSDTSTISPSFPSVSPVSSPSSQSAAVITCPGDEKL